MRRALVLALLVNVLALTSLAAGGVPPALAAAPKTPATRDAWPLHAGSTDSAEHRVSGWQWMISGHCPNRFAVACGGKVRPTLKKYTLGRFGSRTKAGTIALRYRLGFPAKGQCGAKASKLVPEVGPWFWALLRGERDKKGNLIATRPACWVALAESRLEQAEKVEPTPLALAVRSWMLKQVGTHETCGGSCNRGSLIGPGGWSVDSIENVFGLRGLAWCQIFIEVALKENGYKPIPFSPYPFSVIPTYRWAASVGHATAKPQIGSLMTWLGDAGHIGFVAYLNTDSAGNIHGFTTIEGNASDGVRIRQYPVPGSSLRLFINLHALTH